MTHPTPAAELLATWGYPAFLASLAATGIGFPIPEDLLLLAAGYLVSLGIFAWEMTVPLGIIGVMLSDGLLFAGGLRLRQESGRSALVARVLTPERIRLVTTWFDRFGIGVVVAARFVPGTRALVFVAAGLRGVPVRWFVMLDLAAAVVWVPLLVGAGRLLGSWLEDVIRLLDAGRAVIAMALIALVAGLAWRHLGRKR